MTTKMTRGSQTPCPSNIDLINILRQRIGKNKRPSFITDMHNLYEKEPWLLQHVRHVSFEGNLWFYFVTRKLLPGIKKTDSKRPSRAVAESGTWKTTGVLKYIEDKDGVRVGSLKSISFKANSEIVNDGITTGWVMHEFVLDKPGFQELALCRIRFYPRENNAQYAPRLTPIVIGLEQKDGSRLVDNNSQNYPILNGGVEKHQSLSTCGQLLGESSGQQRCPNYFWGQETDPSSMMGHQEYGSSALSVAQYNQYLRHNNDPLAFREQQKHLRQDSNLPLTQQQNNILGQDIHNGPCSAHPYDQYMGENNEIEIPTVHMKTELQQENFVGNSAAQLHLEAQDNVPLINQTMEEQATDPPTDSQKHQELLGDDFFQEMDSEMDNLENDFCVADFIQQFEKIPIPDNLFF